MRTFEEIDRLRAAHALTRKQVYDLAGVNAETWGRLAKGKHKPNLGTLEKLSAALDQLINERAA